MKTLSLAAAALALSLLLATPSAQTTFMPVEEVRAGMEGVGQTVFQGDKLEEFKVHILGVLRDVDARKSLVAILGINSYLFDIMPADLRAQSDVTLELNNNQQLARFALEDIDLVHPIEVTRTSNRYPLHATVRVEQAALTKAYGRGYWLAMLAATGLGLAFGVPDEVAGSALQLVLNLAGMAMAGWATLALQQAVWSRLSARRSRLVARMRRGSR